MAAGLPMVLRPFHADQPWNAARAAEVGVAVTITELQEAGPAVSTVLGEPAYRAAAQAAASTIARMDTPAQALHKQLGGTSGP